jgi:signal transduction histidine kinase
MNPFRSVGARLSLALVGVVALALGLVYLVVVPSLRQRLVDAKLEQLRTAMREVVRIAPQSPQFEPWPDFLESASSIADGARVVVYTFQPPVGATGHAIMGGPIEDSHSVNSRDVENDPIAQQAADGSTTAFGTVSREDNEFAEVAAPIPALGDIVLLSASVHDALANVHTVQRRLLEAGLFALLLALGVGYGAAHLFARRIRRLEVAAERIAAGRFEEPVIDRSADELGQLARAFDRMRLRLAQLERARREFIGNASHELRTPLFSLRGFIELLTDEELDEPTRREFLETMREQVDRLQRLAEDLLDLTRLDAGRMHIERRPVDLAELAEDLYEEFRAVAVSTAHPLELEEAGKTQALGDEERILRIGRALVENALKHTPAGSRVSVRAAGAALVVTDDGPGIPPEHRRDVFERFYRVDGARASGSGLGLAIARELAEAMGGTLELESGGGRTTFTLRLPVASSEQATIPRGNTVPVG